MTTDKTGAPTTSPPRGARRTPLPSKARPSATPTIADRGDQRVFYHTVVDPEYGGRGLATILVEEALNGARDAGKRIVPVCSMVETVLKKHPEFDEITDPVTAEVRGWVLTQPSS